MKCKFKSVYEYGENNLSLQENMDNYVLLILKCMQQTRPTNKVLHGSASNYILSNLHLIGVDAEKLLTSTSSYIAGSDCLPQNRRLIKVWSMSSTTELNYKHRNCMISLSAVYWSS